MRERKVAAGVCRWLVATMFCIVLQPVAALEADFRLKGFGALAALPDHDVQRAALGTPGYDGAIDLRTMLRQSTGDFELILDHTLVYLAGDRIEFSQGPDGLLDQTVTEDDRRLFDLTWRIDSGDRHVALHRLDRLALQWRSGDWNVTVGRQAVSWGSGLVFQPMDLFSPFSPTVVDRDYKAGADLLLVDRLLPHGGDLQLLHVVRRDDRDRVSPDVSSTGIKWHGYAGEVEFETVLGRHFDDSVAAISVRLPVGQAMVRSDLVGVRAQQPGGDSRWRVSGILNADYSFMLGERNAYVFGEFFFNDWGVSSLPASAASLPLDLQQRLARGELFNLMRRYLAFGGNYEIHPLISTSVLLIGNLDDRSALLQWSVAYSPSDHQTLQAGWISALGDAGDEFGGVPLMGDALTSGGGHRGYLRWSYYF